MANLVRLILLVTLLLLGTLAYGELAQAQPVVPAGLAPILQPPAPQKVVQPMAPEQTFVTYQAFQIQYDYSNGNPLFYVRFPVFPPAGGRAECRNIRFRMDNGSLVTPIGHWSPTHGHGNEWHLNRYWMSDFMLIYNEDILGPEQYTAECRPLL